MKVEATKFTEVGYHGRDVDQIIRDLMDVSMQLTRRLWTEKLRAKAAAMVEDKILDLLGGPVAPAPEESSSNEEEGDEPKGGEKKSTASRGRESFRTMLREGVLDDQLVELSVPVGDRSSGGSDFPLGGRGDESNPQIIAMSDLYQRLSSASGTPKKQTERRKMPVSEARKVIEDMELDKLLETVDIKKEAVQAVEQSGIVFIDEM